MAWQIPKEIAGWVGNTEVPEYDRESLFEYIDGGAELYLAYRFRKAFVHHYAKAGEPDIIVDIYDMSTPEDAYGIFTSEREGDDIGIGHGSEYAPGLLRFFKGRFFVSIMTHEETPASRKAVFVLAKAVADNIHSTGKKPELVSSLPQRGLIERSVRYFYNHDILNHHYYIADENILHLDRYTGAVLARYAVPGGKPYLLLVKYPSKPHVNKAYQSFVKAYMPEAIQAGIVRTERGQWTAAQVNEKLLAIVFDAPTRDSAASLLRAVHRPSGDAQ